MKEVIPKVRILGIPFSIMGMEETVSYCEALIQSQETHHVITANPEIVMLAQEKAELKEIIENAQLVTCDGTGIVWATRNTDFPAKERVTGYDLTLQLLSLSEKKGFSVYFVGSKPEVMKLAVENSKKRWPTLSIAGYHHGYFRVGDEEKIISDIREKKPSILFVALGAPKQEYWISKNMDELNVPLVIGVGGSLDVLSGTIKRAPKLWQTWHLEWLYRLFQQPSRWNRMIAIPKFVVNVLINEKMSGKSTKK